MTHSPFYDSFCIGFVLFFEIGQSLPLKRSTFIPFPPFIALFIALLIAWSVALHTQTYAGTILYINPCTLATEKNQLLQFTFHVHSPLKPQIGFAFFSPHSSSSSSLTLFTWNLVTLLYLYSSPVFIPVSCPVCTFVFSHLHLNLQPL